MKVQKTFQLVSRKENVNSWKSKNASLQKLMKKILVTTWKVFQHATTLQFSNNETWKTFTDIKTDVAFSQVINESAKNFSTCFQKRKCEFLEKQKCKFAKVDEKNLGDNMKSFPTCNDFTIFQQWNLKNIYRYQNGCCIHSLKKSNSSFVVRRRSKKIMYKYCSLKRHTILLGQKVTGHTLISSSIGGLRDGGTHFCLKVMESTCRKMG